MRFAFLFFLLSIINPAAADKQPLETICDMAEAKLKVAKHATYSRSRVKFKDTYDEVYYKGCVLTVSGTIASEPDYYKILMGLYPNPNKSLFREGWKADRQSDGPDGVSFTIVKQNFFCQVSGDWPAKVFNYRVECGTRR